ncbi:MAG: HtpX2, heat shock protein HtpX, heat shock protein HtpX [Patescibacteria group bacterium]|nr:HtpX2, heat shock protein HtpX, heat shock protein HtpX [Patescibacteria group bacterium]
MATLYTQQSSNVTKTWILMSSFFIVLVGIGFAFSYLYNNVAILVVFAVVAFVMNIVAYWNSDSIALSSARAVPADPIQFRDLHNVVENLAITAGLPKPRVYVISDPAPNAFATGRDKEHAAVAVTTGLLGMMDRNELEGVIAHELSHIGNRDILLSTVVVVLVGLIALASNFFLRSMAFGGGRGNDREGNGNVIFLVLGIVGVILAPIVATIIQLAISRKREFLADAAGALLTRYPEGLVSALKKIENYNRPMLHPSTATAHLFIANPFGPSSKFLSSLFATHPPTDDRVKALLGNQ